MELIRLKIDICFKNNNHKNAKIPNLINLKYIFAKKENDSKAISIKMILDDR